VSENKEKDKRVLLLYSTSGCHLCELAKGLVETALLFEPFTLRIIDIANDDTLFENYGIRIPVIKFENSQQELSWPFDLDKLSSYLVLALDNR
jgi:hypothetical protein